MSQSPAIVAVQLCQKRSIFGYKGNEDRLFLKIITHLPTHIAPAKRHLERGMNIPVIGDIVFKIQISSYIKVCNPTYESNLAYLLRFMIDCQIVGCNWIEIPAKKYKIRSNRHTREIEFANSRSSADSDSNCQIEIDVFYSDLISHVPEGEWSAVAPLRVLSFDIECAGRKGIF